jgi:hypothetical protein
MGSYPSNPDDLFSNFDQQLNEVGIFSLSETAENQLMWSHYGEESRGIAIGFETSEKSKLTDKDHCLQVNYSDVLPTFKGNGFINQTSFYMDEFGRPYTKQKISLADKTFKLAVSTKPTVWNYEREWRYIEENSGSYPLPSKISEIVFGLRCSEENRDKYKTLIKDNFQYPISLFEIKNTPNTNKIEKVALE